jgi:hypothetical protein
MPQPAAATADSVMEPAKVLMCRFGRSCPSALVAALGMSGSTVLAAHPVEGRDQLREESLIAPRRRSSNDSSTSR